MIMRKKRIFPLLAAAFLAATVLSCDKVFDSLEGDLTKMTAEDMMSSEAGILGQLANLYGYIPMGAFSTGDRNTMMANSSRSTNSYSVSGISSFWNYTNMRSINRFIKNLDVAVDNKVISETVKNNYLGEALFIRAYCYFASVRVYGGVPIVTEPLDQYYDGGQNEGLYIARSTEKETWDWVLDQLTQAIELLPVKQAGDMRITKDAALALKVRVALWAASESKYWNRAAINNSYNAVQKKYTYMEPSYAADYYKQCIDAAQELISSGRHGLYGSSPSSVSAAVDNLVDLFQDWNSMEGIFGRSYVDGTTTSGNGIESWAPFQVSGSGWGAGTGSVTLNLADLYDAYASSTDRSHVNGVIQTRMDGDESDYVRTPEETVTFANVSEYKHYSSINEPFLLKDARFQAWIVYPDCVFRGTVIKMQAGIVTPDKQVLIYPIENAGIEFGGTVYYPYGGAGENSSSFYKLSFDTNANNRSDYSFMIRKFLDPNGMNEHTQSPWYDMRYAEVLLSYAEAVIESGQGDKTKAKQYLNDVRHRAGFTDDVDLTIDNVLHEWKVEFAFENILSAVMYRRRAFYNPDYPQYALEGTVGQKLTLVPIVDLSGDSASYIFVRAASYFNDIKRSGNSIQVQAESYYGQIPNYTNNRIDPNNR